MPVRSDDDRPVDFEADWVPEAGEDHDDHDRFRAEVGHPRGEDDLRYLVDERPPHWA